MEFVGDAVAEFPIWDCDLVELDGCDGLGEEAAEELSDEGKDNAPFRLSVKRR
jgi:hypothetical protein